MDFYGTNRNRRAFLEPSIPGDMIGRNEASVMSRLSDQSKSGNTVGPYASEVSIGRDAWHVVQRLWESPSVAVES